MLHHNILIPKKEFKIEVEGHCRGFQTELDYVEKNGILFPIDTGKVVPHTEWKARNTLQTGLLYYLAYKIGTNTTDRALDDLFISSGLVAAVGAANDGKDGIVEGPSGAAEVEGILVTTLNDGGTEAEAYIEFYGYMEGAYSLDDNLILGHNFVDSTDSITEFSKVSINQEVAANRRYHHYWKITLAAA